MELIIVAGILGALISFSLLGWLLPTDHLDALTIRDGEIVPDTKETNS